MKDVLHAPLLVSTQRAEQPIWKDALLVDLTGEVLGQAEGSAVSPQDIRNYPLEDVVVGDGENMSDKIKRMLRNEVSRM